ncbi:MAG: hypothetical protein VW405_07430, partial [Rhodospirillaceae bacterium]
KPDGKQNNIAPIEDSHYCKDLSAFCGFEARRTVGRLMRPYLDEYGLTALELAFDAGRLTMLEHNDKLFPAAVQRVAQLQAKQAKANPVDRANAIYKAVAEIKDLAKQPARADQVAETMAAKGLGGALDAIDMSVERAEREIVARFAMARYLSRAADWNGKFELLTKLAQGELSERATVLLDEAMAELADAASAIMELLAGQPDRGTAARTLVLLAAGRCPTPKKPLS